MEFWYWKAKNGEQPAWDFISGLPDEEAKQRLVKKLETYEQYSFAALWRLETFKKVEGMIEIRILLNGQHYRLFGAMEEHRCILFYGFVKKSRKIPLKHLKAAINNFKQYKNNH